MGQCGGLHLDHSRAQFLRIVQDDCWMIFTVPLAFLTGHCISQSDGGLKYLCERKEYMAHACFHLAKGKCGLPSCGCAGRENRFCTASRSCALFLLTETYGDDADLLGDCCFEAKQRSTFSS